jgi:hypothetical protein
VLSSLVAVLILSFVAGCGVRPSGFGGSWLGSGAADGASIKASNESTSALPAGARQMSIAASKPIDAYVLLGRRIKSCWFNAVDPVLPNHVYQADVSPSGSKVQITIHQRQDLGQAGLATYAIDFKQEGTFTVVRTANRNMPPDLAAKMQYDIERWKRGDTNCNKRMPKSAAAAAVANPEQPNRGD